MMGDPSSEAVLTGLYEQNLRVRDPKWTLDKLTKECRVAFKKSRRERPITTVVLECSPELRDLLVSLDRVFIGWEAIPGTRQRSVRPQWRVVRHAIDLGDATPKLTRQRRGIAQHESSRKSDTYPSPGMDRRGGLRVGQINLGGSVEATRELPETAQRLGLDLVLVQEQYTSAENIIQTGTTPKAGIMVTRTNLTLTALAHLSTQHCMVAHVGPNDLYVISGYFQYSDRIDPHLEHLGSVLNALRGKRVIVGVDSNVHSAMWHCERRQYTGRGAEAEHRRQQMECFIAERSLMLHNREDQPATFAGARGESNIDLTLSTSGVAVNDWSVLEDASVSDHRLIVYTVDGV
ncbi:Retrovirus-related Pol polyprotein from type-1 retrotransposable element R1 [Eumeta japonica]|uniref:Retrovirus-related Pol polyprotein from type-1 retrotransposable element R1 n=1 Tax=Eumeta variegata TaxID=151549 RepID=A0A4C1XJD0_EUMVA|nr:Retrovirus-related Pol polyprotein from type-1 retrotransposable element R1 [Eumeta japonica]